MGKEVISDFLVRLGFDGQTVIKGVAQTEAALTRLKKLKIDSVKTTKNVEMDQAVRATRQRIQAEQLVSNMKAKALTTSARAEQLANKAKTKEVEDAVKAARKRIQAEQLVNRIKAKEVSKAAIERRREQNHLKALLRARASLRRSPMFSEAGTVNPDTLRLLRNKLSKTTNVEQVKQLRHEAMQYAKGHKQATAAMARQLSYANALKFSIRGLVSSVKNLARSWMSVFAIIGGAIAGIRFTQQFQALDASILAVSESTESAAANVKYLKDLVKQLPVDITTAGDNFKNMLASGRESMGEAGVKELFTSLSEFGTALQVDPERMNRGMQAISQMLNKGQIMAEELKQQFAEQMPGGIQVFSRALNMTTEELFAAMENGELLAKDVLPLVSKELARTARANGALEKSLRNSRSQWTIFVSGFKMLFDGFGSSRLDRGLGSFIAMLSKLFEVIKPIAQTLFWLLGVVIDLVAIVGKGLMFAFDPWLNILKALETPLKTVGVALNKADDATMEWLGNLARFAPFLVPFLRMALILGAIAEEITNIFTGHAQGFLAGEGETIGERMSNGFINKWMLELQAWWEQIFIPWFRNKAAELADIMAAAMKNVFPEWLVKLMTMEVPQPVKNLGNVSGMLDSTGSALGLENASKLFDIKGMLFSTARGLDEFFGTARKQPQTTSLTVNIDGKEAIKEQIERERTIDLLTAM